jgi:hypothetical protein
MYVEMAEKVFIDVSCRLHYYFFVILDYTLFIFYIYCPKSGDQYTRLAATDLAKDKPRQ